MCAYCKDLWPTSSEISITRRMKTARGPRETEGGIELHMHTIVCHSTITGENIKFATWGISLLVNMLVTSRKNGTFILQFAMTSFFTVSRHLIVNNCQ